MPECEWACGRHPFIHFLVCTSGYHKNIDKSVSRDKQDKTLLAAFLRHELVPGGWPSAGRTS